MQPEQLVLPTLATIALGAALLVPLRDDRRGKRATLGGVQPMHTEFYALETERNEVAVVTSAPELTPEPISEAEPASTPTFESTQTTMPTAPQSDERHDPHLPITLVTFATAPLLDVAAPPALDESSTDKGSRPKRASIPKRPISERLRSIAKLLGFTPKSASAVDVSQSSAPLEQTRSFASELDMLLTPNRGAAEHCEPSLQSDLASREPTAFFEPVETSPHAHEVTVVPAQRSPMGRVVPLTRLPLRPQRSSITWTHSLADIAAFARNAEVASSDRHLRHALLYSLSESPNEDAAASLQIACGEEDAEGRCLALQAIMRLRPTEEARAIYIDALRSGTDDERSIAIDALVRIGDRAAIIPAFNDRLDALAAKAALAYVDSIDRAAYVAALEPHVDRAQIDAILALLAGIVE